MLKVIGFLGLTIYFIVFLAFIRLDKRNKDFKNNQLINIGKSYKMIVETDEYGENLLVKKVKLFKGEREIDSEITQYKEFVFSCFFKGEEGFYIYNKVSGKLHHTKDINELSEHPKKMFHKYLM
ncbi:hypothetical protein PZE06_08655 [Robertmurraya sp. DFI.2.37]|uniref:hypothetical protein n=1 Tax=Robertmurraya sp. DFI.2.37 TaxID=3031819 RepID=UPI0012480C67|nr:hypothetical protein [Robertmurraya sp. DFI.2.37]MDF1508255.1 hypothetical protein [Robertmurraya sp. DFI.2.37]